MTIACLPVCSQETDDVELVFDIPGCGDTAFPSILRIDKVRCVCACSFAVPCVSLMFVRCVRAQHTYIIVNYTNPTGLCAEWPWILGQVASQGTQIYFLLLTFVPQ